MVLLYLLDDKMNMARMLEKIQKLNPLRGTVSHEVGFKVTLVKGNEII